jgi:hypothetical protein
MKERRFCMAVKRCIPTSFFKDPDIANVSHESQLLLIGLALCGDDEGRGTAAPRLLGREVDYSPEQIETALQELAENDLIVLYQVGRHRYYQLTQDWQKSMGAKRTPSRLPAPEATLRETSELPPESTELPPESTQSPPESTPQYNLIQVNLIEDEEKSCASSNVITFPAPTVDSSGVSQEILDTTGRIASILKLNVTDALTRIVQEYTRDPALSLLGEADAAREWIDDPRRNKKPQRMTPAFFRRWLKREQAQQAAPSSTRATGTTDAVPASPTRERPGLSGRSLMGLAAQYQKRAGPATFATPDSARSRSAPSGGAHG